LKKKGASNTKLNGTPEIYKALFKSFPIPTYIWKYYDKDFELLDYNQAANLFADEKMEGILGRKLTDLYKKRQDIIDDIFNCFKNKLDLSKEIRYFYKTTGTFRNLYVIYKYIPPDIILVFTEDITEKEEVKNNLRKAEKEKSIILDSISELIVFQDKEHNIFWANKAAADSINLTPEHLIGKKCYALWHNSNVSCKDCPVRASIELGSPVSGEVTSPDGRVWLIKGFPVRDDEGNVIGAVEITNEITKIKQTAKLLKESEKRYQYLFESSPYSIGIFDLDGNLLDCNKATNLFLSKHTLEGDIIGKNFREFWSYHEKDKPNILLFEKILEKTIKDEKPLTFEFPIHRSIGDKLWVSAIASLSKIGKEPVVQFIIQDITKRKNTEQKLKQSEIKYREAYDHINFYKDIFTHDINNIFQNIQSSVELFTLNVQGDINLDKDDELLEIIRDQVKRGTNLVSNIRKLSEIEDHKLVLNKIELIEVLQEIKNNLIKIYKKRKIIIQIQCDYKKLFIKTNELLRVVFENILINAIIHNQNPLIEIIIKISKVFKDEIYYLKLEFFDNGIGILPKMKEKVFQRGYNEKKDKMGLGLGLTLVKKIIENYNGQIWVEDRVEGDYTKGSNFILLIPEVN